MKRLLCFILTTLFMFAMSSCDNKTTSKEDIYGDGSKGISLDGFNNSSIPSGKKIEGEINNGSFFSEGLAFVCLNKDEGKTYCINKKGEIVFELDKELKVQNILRGFKNGYVLVDGYICNIKGELTSPEDVGVTKFYDIALEDGYILVEKVTADYAFTKKEVGVMDTSFQWVLDPSENIYTVLENSLWLTTAINSEDYYYKDVIYFDGCKQYLNIKTGELTTEPPFEEPSYAWKSEGNQYYDNQGNLKLDLSEYENISCGKFINGKARASFDNKSANKKYFTIINEKGEFLFEPIEIAGYLEFFGEYVLAYKGDIFSKNGFLCYNLNGNIIGTLDYEQFGDRSVRVKMNDGVIFCEAWQHYKSSKYYYYDINCNPLF